jgi:hypothetical protein
MIEEGFQNELHDDEQQQEEWFDDDEMNFHDHDVQWLDMESEVEEMNENFASLFDRIQSTGMKYFKTKFLQFIDKYPDFNLGIVLDRSMLQPYSVGEEYIGLTLLGFAAENGHRDMIRLMMEHGMPCTFDDEHKVEDLLVGMMMCGQDYLLKELILNFDINPNEGPIYQDHMDEFTISQMDLLLPACKLFKQVISVLSWSTPSEYNDCPYRSIAKFLFIDVPICLQRNSHIDSQFEKESVLKDLLNRSSFD